VFREGKERWILFTFSSRLLKEAGWISPYSAEKRKKGGTAKLSRGKTFTFFAKEKKGGGLFLGGESIAETVILDGWKGPG